MEAGQSQNHSPQVVDAHAHIFCWGENVKEGYLSERTRRSWLTRLIIGMTRIRREPGNTLSEKLRNRLLRQAGSSSLDYVVVLAQDAVYHPDGSRNDAQTHFYVSNDYVLDLAKRSSKILPGCSINPIRSDALQELERCYAAGCRLFKIHTAIQGVDPERPDFDPFYALAREMGVVLMFHTGYEHSCKVVSQQFTDPRRLERPLSHGGPVIAAHCGTCGFFDREDFFPNFAQMMTRHDNLHGDTAIMASLIRWSSLKRLSGTPDWLRHRVIHGSDYPFPPARLPYLFRTGFVPRERENPLDMDLCIKRTFSFGPAYENQVLRLMNPAPRMLGV